jgi:cytochrome c oxidase subunit II
MKTSRLSIAARRRRGNVLHGVFLLPGCSGRQSALEPAGRGAEQIAELYSWMAAGAVLVWLAMVALTVYALSESAPHKQEKAKLLIIGGGAAVPTLILTGLLVYGLLILRSLSAPAPPGTLQVAVSGEQWWWRVRYLIDGKAIELANEVRLPVGKPVEFHVASFDVVHSFWIPSLGPKMDMIPGRTNRLVLHPTRTGTFRGVCAEYCGESHALMAFDVVVLTDEEFAGWLDHQSQPARTSSESLVAEGRKSFFASGCGACHAVRGTEADGVVGPDLTHVGSRASLGAGTLPNDADGFLRWISQTGQIKPGVQMPHFGMLPLEERRAIAAYLESLE